MELTVFLAVLVAALGDFVDMFDLVMFSILRIPSLRGIPLGMNPLLNSVRHTHSIRSPACSGRSLPA